MIPTEPPVNFVGARKGATGTLDDLKDSPPVPKAWVKPALVDGVIKRLQDNQQSHSRLDLHSIVVNHFYDLAKERYRIVWSKNMITSAGVSLVRTKGGSELVIALRPEVQPGDELNLKIVREGKEDHQGVAYLEDGTMVVVENARSAIGERRPVVITGALQNPSGRMVFARLDQDRAPTVVGKESKASKPPRKLKSNERPTSESR